MKTYSGHKKMMLWIFVAIVIVCAFAAIFFYTGSEEKPTPGYDELNAMISEHCGAEASVFAVEDGVKGYLFAGYQTETRVGIAYFPYDAELQKYVFGDYQENFPEYPFAFTLGEEAGLDHCVTIAVSACEDVAYIEMVYENTSHEVGVPFSPVMVLQEWDSLFLPVVQESEVQTIFYDADHEKLGKSE